MRIVDIGLLALSAVLLPNSAGSAHSAAPAASPEPVIQTDDVARFYRVYDAADGHPTVEQIQRDYLDAGTDGLRTFARLRNTTAQRIVDAIANQPDLYVNARRCAATLPPARRRLALALDRLRAVYPPAKLPPVTITIGRGKPVGVGSPVTGLQIGLESLCGVTYADPNLEDRFVHVVAHEYVHVQQPVAQVDDPNPTVLQGALVEGAAEFVAELISGGVAYAEQAKTLGGRELEIETAFAADLDKRDLTDWLYNSTMTKQGDLGYWVGYRIVKSYYLQARDKRAAVRDIINVTDPKAFLQKSGWYPGKKLDTRLPPATGIMK